MTMLGKLPSYARLAVRLRAFLQEPLEPARAERLVDDARLERRQRFLTLLRTHVFGNAAGPYGALVRHAGMALPDIEHLVRRDGIEGALSALAANGVYIRLDEFKGRVPIRRGSLEVATTPRAFDSPSISAGLPVRSGATRSIGTPSLIALELLTEEAAHFSLMLAAYGHGRGSVALWLPILPGSAGVKNLLRFAKLGRPPTAWFSHAPVPARARTPDQLLTQAVLKLGSLYGTPMPVASYTPLDEADRVAAWAATHARDGGRCQIITYVSSAVRVATQASRLGTRLDGTLFIVLGEPLTAARAAAIRESGAEVTATYSLAEAGLLGSGCGQPAAADDVHVLLDRVAIIQERVATRDRLVDGLFLTTLAASMPKIMINVESGDSGRLVRRSCTCPYGKLGYVDHLVDVTSYEKFTGEGMTYDASELARIIDDVLPRRFGGAPTDYQMVEESSADGTTRLTLLVSPRVDVPDEEAVLAVVKGELRNGPANQRLAELIWGQANALRVVRREPEPTSRGKQFPFHIHASGTRPATPRR